MKTYNDVYIETRRRLRAAGVTMSDLEARLIISHVSGLTSAELLRDAKQLVTDSFIDNVEALTARRESGEPIAYILGEWEFYGLPLTVSPAVLIPRSDTETLARSAIEAATRIGGRALDLCAGSGCVGLAIAASVPDCRVVLADISAEALKLCSANILRNGLTARVTSVTADARSVPSDRLGGFDVIVCNPPYIPTREIDTLDHSVRGFEPHLALDGGGDGLDFYRDVADKWRAALIPGGVMLFECGMGQARDVQAIMETNGFTDTAIIDDARGIGRVVTGRIGG